MATPTIPRDWNMPSMSTVVADRGHGGRSPRGRYRLRFDRGLPVILAGFSSPERCRRNCSAPETCQAIGEDATMVAAAGVAMDPSEGFGTPYLFVSGVSS